MSVISLDIIQCFFYSYLNPLISKIEIIRYILKRNHWISMNHFNFLKNYILKYKKYIYYKQNELICSFKIKITYKILHRKIIPINRLSVHNSTNSIIMKHPNIQNLVIFFSLHLVTIRNNV